MNGLAVRTLLSLLPACGGPRSAADTAASTATCAEDTADPAPDWDTWAEPFFTTWCQPCHAADAPQRYGAPVGTSFDSEDDARTHAAAIQTTVLDNRTMPVGGGLSAQDEARLAAWLCAVEASP